MKFFAKQLIKIALKANEKLIAETAIKNCHVTGLHSFLLNKSPKVRLFIADNNCALRLPFDYKNPYLTIHAHKHNDIFIPLTNEEIIHHFYKHVDYVDEKSIPFSLNEYNRLDGNTKNGRTGGSDWLEYIGHENRMFMGTKELHTVSILGPKKCAWIIIEIGTDEDFIQLSFGGEQITSDCYQKFDNPIQYIKDYFEI